jgi:DNA adenine methylase
VSREPALRPPLKWAGGKRWLIPFLMEPWGRHAHRRLVEPFVGGLAVTLGLQPAEAVLNDANPHVVSFYRWLQRGLMVSGAGSRFKNNRDIYLRNRERFNELIAEGAGESEEAALLFYYLNRTGFNGLCRFNASGFLNVPFGRYKTIPYRSAFTEYREALAPYEFTTGDFESVALRPSDFVYADPPYDVEFTSYSAGGFDWDDQLRLAHWLAAHPGPVVASNQATGRVLKLYKGLGFTIRTLAAPRRISCDGNRDDAKEMFALKGVPEALK